MHKILLPLFILFSLLQISSSAAQEYFNRSYPPPEDKNRGSLNAGKTYYGYLETGTQFYLPSRELYFTALNENGDPLWEHIFVFPTHNLYQAKQAFFPLPDHSFIVAGSGSPLIDSLQRIVYVAKIAETGNLLWFKVIKQSSFFISAIGGTNNTDGNFVFCGQTFETDPSASDCLLLCVNPQGEVLWERSIGGPWFQSAESIAQTADGGYAIAGSNRPGQYMQILVLKTDGQGNELWRKTIGGTYNQPEFKFITALQNGDVLVSTAAGKSNSTHFDAFAARLSSSGAILWQRKYEHEWNNSFFTQGRELPDGSIVLGGYRGQLIQTDSSQSITRFSTLTRIDANGNIIWDRLFFISNIGVNWFYGFIPTSDGGYFCYGSTTDPTQRSWVVKTDALGCDTAGCAPITGVIPPPGLPQEALTLQAFPNPFSGQLRLEYGLPAGIEDAQLQIHDTNGRRLWYAPLLKGVRAGDVVWAPGSLPPGIYLATLSAPGLAPVTVKVVAK